MSKYYHFDAEAGVLSIFDTVGNKLVQLPMTPAEEQPVLLGEYKGERVYSTPKKPKAKAKSSAGGGITSVVSAVRRATIKRRAHKVVALRHRPG